MAEFKKLFLDKLTEISNEVKSLKIIMEENTSEIRSTLLAISKKVEINTDKSKNNEVLILGIYKRCLHGGKTTMLYLNLSGHSKFFKKRFGTSPEKHCLTAMPCRLFQGNLNPKRFKPI